MAGPAEVVDATTFLGMHADKESVRTGCKTFFVQRLHRGVTMSLEHVGWCDDVVWGHPRSTQDAYYPFMDTLHTEMTIHRHGYDETDVQTAFSTPGLISLPMRERLLMGMVLRRGAVLHTTNPRLTARHDLPVAPVPPTGEQSFPAHLEQLYQSSLTLRIPIETL